MNLRKLLGPILLLTGFNAMCASAQVQKPTFAILNLPSGVYLQMDVTNLSGTEEPVIDAVRFGMREGTVVAEDGLVQARAALNVTVTTVPLTVNSETKITQGQIIKKLEVPVTASCPTCKDTVRALHVDTISFYSYTSSAIWRQIAPPHVNALSLTPRVHCAVKYAAPSCLGEKGGCRDMFIKQFVEVWKVKPYAAILEPSPILTFVYVSPWNQTTGKEDIAGIATPSVGNTANWIDIERSRLATRTVLKEPQKPIPSPAITLLPVWNIPTGAVHYLYNRTASPELKILEVGDHRIVGDLIKIGPTLEVSRTARPNGCLPPRPDSTLGSSSWLVLADSASEGSMEKAMELNDNPFGPPRTSAWKISGDTVWLDGSTKIPLADLLAATQGTTRILPDAPAAGCRLAHTGEGIALELDRGAQARIVGSDGQILSDWKDLSAGRHAMPTTASGVGFVQVRAEWVHATLPLLR